MMTRRGSSALANEGRCVIQATQHHLTSTVLMSIANNNAAPSYIIGGAPYLARLGKIFRKCAYMYVRTVPSILHEVAKSK